MTMRTNAFWFFVAFLVGGAAVWWTKLAVTNAWFAAMVAAGVVFALMIYYLLNDEDAPEQEGDNVYYLGLLFTLISLMFALLDLFGSDAIAIPNAEKIRALLENFGIALTSTVVGIAGRVVLHNWQRTGTAGTTEFPEDIAGQLALSGRRLWEGFRPDRLGLIEVLWRTPPGDLARRSSGGLCLVVTLNLQRRFQCRTSCSATPSFPTPAYGLS